MRPLGRLHRGLAVAARAVLSVLAASVLAGCASVGYYWQSVDGHVRLMAAARPVDDWLQDPATPEAVKERLRLAARMRAFASDQLRLPDNPSYRRYADLGRPAAVWNVVAAPPLSLTLRTWCFPVAGCVGYRGWFDEARARAEGDALREQGLDVSVYPVPAYSTLGWLNAFGGDPLLNTFIQDTEAEIARLIFHELAHQVVYVRDDTAFNESFATAVERLGVTRWLALQGSDAARHAHAQRQSRREQFRALTQATRAALARLYDEPAGPSGLKDTADQLARKQDVLADFRAAYGRLRASWGLDPARPIPLDRWVADANNATFGAQAAYDDLVPGFEALFLREGQDWSRFYDSVKQLSRLPRPERHRRLQEFANARSAHSP